MQNYEQESRDNKLHSHRVQSADVLRTLDPPLAACHQLGSNDRPTDCAEKNQRNCASRMLRRGAFNGRKPVLLRERHVDTKHRNRNDKEGEVTL